MERTKRVCKAPAAFTYACPEPATPKRRKRKAKASAAPKPPRASPSKPRAPKKTEVTPAELEARCLGEAADFWATDAAAAAALRTPFYANAFVIGEGYG